LSGRLGAGDSKSSGSRRGTLTNFVLRRNKPCAWIASPATPGFSRIYSIAQK
jgi:hypothetical protein